MNVSTNCQGPDVSKWDGGPAESLQTINFALLKERYPFTLIKVSEGTGKDPLFDRQWAAARGHVARGAYHFWRSFVNQAVAVDKMVEYLGADLGEMEIILDLEVADGSSSVMALVKVWVEECQRRTGRWPWIYSTRGFLHEHGADYKSIWGVYKNAWLAKCQLWLAEWPFDELESMPGYVERGDALRAILIQEVIDGRRELTWPKPIAPWTQVDMWQWTSRFPPAQIPGYYMGPNHKQAVDMNFHRLGRFAFEAAYPVSGLTPPPPGGTMYYYRAIVNVDKLNVRAAASASSADIGDVYRGNILYGNDVVGEPGAAERWLHVLEFNGLPLEGWVAVRFGGVDYCDLVIQSTPPPPPSNVTASIELNDNGVIYKGSATLVKQ